jgi:DNA-damage-inducible protein D
MEQNKIVVFESKKIRRIWHNEEWLFSVVDIVEALTDSVNPRDYWYRMKIREKDEAQIELSTTEVRGVRWQKVFYRLRQ